MHWRNPAPRDASRPCARASLPIRRPAKWCSRPRAARFSLLTVAACFQALAGYAVLSWGAAFLMRVHHLDFSEVGVSFGLVAGIGGAPVDSAFVISPRQT